VAPNRWREAPNREDWRLLAPHKGVVGGGPLTTLLSRGSTGEDRSRVLQVSTMTPQRLSDKGPDEATYAACAKSLPGSGSQPLAAAAAVFARVSSFSGDRRADLAAEPAETRYEATGGGRADE
jgi:hypothetical protein